MTTMSDRPTAVEASPAAPDASAGPPGPDLAAHALRATPAYWFSMLAASALGTNLGDFWVNGLSLDRGTSFASLLAISVLAILWDRRFGARNDAGYWIAIVALRAAATTIGDYLTHDMALSYVVVTVISAVITLLAAQLTRTGTGVESTPRIDGRYWLAMLLAGIFGTVGGDLASHTIGLYAAAGLLCAVTLLLIGARGRVASTSAMAYWVVVLAERCAGTSLGDSIASKRALGLGLPVAMACTGGLLLVGLLARRRASAALATQP